MATKQQIREMNHSEHLEEAIDSRRHVILNNASLLMLDAQLHATLAVYKFLLEERDEEMEHARRQFEVMTKR